MELSARDKRILAEIECESALEDPRWARRFERLGRLGVRTRPRWRRRLTGALIAALWLTVVIAAAMLPIWPLFGAALGAGLGGYLSWKLRHRRVYAYWFRRQRRISRIPRQDARDNGEGGRV
jgi:hypothetical protein